MKRSFAFALLLSILPAAGTAQRPTAGETIEVSIVNVDVFVTDKSGNRVRGLTLDDFDVFENGAKQPITNFAEYAAPYDPLPLAEGARRAGEGQSDRQRRTIAVFVERFRLPKIHADPVFTSMKKLLREAVRPGDAVTVVTWYKGRLTTVQT